MGLGIRDSNNSPLKSNFQLSNIRIIVNEPLNTTTWTNNQPNDYPCPDKIPFQLLQHTQMHINHILGIAKSPNVQITADRIHGTFFPRLGDVLLARDRDSYPQRYI